MSLKRRQLLAGISAAAALTMMSAPAFAAFGLVSGGHGFLYPGNNGGTTTALNTTGGNLVVVFSNYSSSYGPNPPMLLDNKGNTYSAFELNTAGSDSYTVCYYAQNATCGAGHTWTVADPTGIGTPTGCYSTLNVMTFSGAPTSGALELVTSNYQSSNATSITSTAPIYPFSNGSLILSYVVNYTDSSTTDRTIDSGLTVLDQTGFNGTQYLGQATAWGVQTTAASINPTWSWTGNQNFSHVVTVSISAAASQATQTIAWDTSYTGVLPRHALYGWLANLTWSGGVVTATINGAAAGGFTTNGDTTLGSIGIGSKICVAIGTGSAGNTPAGYSGFFTATVTSSTTFTYPLASNPGTAPSPIATAWFASLLQTYIGGTNGSPDLTYWSNGNVTSGAAADSSHIVLATTETAACVGHAIQVPSLSSNWCLITDYNTSTNIATVSASVLPYGALPASIAANFGSTPGSGVAYRIAQSLHEFDFGLSASGNSVWTSDISCGQVAETHAGGAIQLYGKANLFAGCYVHIKGVLPYSFTAAAPGTLTTGSAPVISNGLTTNCTHTSLFLMGIDMLFENIQLNITQLTNELALFYPDASEAEPNVKLSKCILKGGVGVVSGHEFIFEHPGYWNTCVLDTCLMVHTNACIASETTSNNQLVMIQCSYLNSAGAGTTVNTTVSSGATSVLVNAGVGMSAINSTASPIYVNHPNVPEGTTATVTGTGPYTLALSAATTGALNAGDAITLSVSITFIPPIGSGMHALLAGNCAFLGTAQMNSTAANNLYTTCATELTQPSATGLTLSINGPGAFTAGYGAGTGAIDLRLPSGSALRSGGTTISGKTDLIGNTFSGEIGALAYQAPASSGAGANFFHTSPF